MIRRAYIIGFLAVALSLTTVSTTPAYCRLMISARNFSRYFHDLNRSGNSLSPIERVVFSLVLANAMPVDRQHPEPVPPPRG